MFGLFFSYWRYHKRRLLMLMFSLILAMGSVVFMVFWNRSSSLLAFENMLNLSGNYDYIIFDITEDKYEKIITDGYLDQVGGMTIYGTCCAKNDEYYVMGSLDEEGIYAYHHQLKSGRYPIYENEITTTEKVFINLGVVPAVGEQIELTLFDNDNQEYITDTYIISGVLEEILTGRQEQLYNYKPDFKYPEIFFSDELELKGVQHLLASQSLEYTHKETESYLSSLQSDIYYCWRRAMAEFTIAPVGGYVTRDSISNNLQYAQKDFESSVATPICAVLIIVIAGICVYVSANIVYRGRQRQFLIMRSLGMSKRCLLLFLIMEAVGITMLSLMLGYLLGSGAYMFVIHFSGMFLQEGIPLAFSVPDVVAATTLNPILYPTGICTLCAFWGFFLAIRTAILRNNLLEQPLGELSKNSNQAKENAVNKLLHQVLIKKKISSMCVFTSILILLTSTYFGLLYYSEKIENETSSLQSKIDSMGTYGFDYLATKDFTRSICARAQINRQEITGINPAILSEVLASNTVKSYAYGIEIRGTRVSEPELKEEVEACLQKVNLYASVENSLLDLAIMTKMTQGYEAEEILYNIPTLAISEDQFSNFETYILSGEINIDELKQGKEIVLVLDSSETKCPYAVGDVLCLSDVVIGDEEVSIFDFSGDQVPEQTKPSFYYNYIWSDGTVEQKAGYSFGMKEEVEVRIGAIVTMENHPLKDFYYTAPVNGEAVGIYILTLADAVSEWGFPDKNITKLGIQTDDDERFELTWFEMIAQSSEMEEVRVTKVVENTIETAVKNALFFIILLLIVSGMAMFAIYSSISLSIRTQMRKIAQMKALGMNHGRLCYFYIQTSLIYLGIASLFAWIPAFVFHRVYLYLIDKIDGYIAWTDKKPWYAMFPYYDFTTQPFIQYYIASIAAIGLLLVICVLRAVGQTRKYDISVIVKRENEY